MTKSDRKKNAAGARRGRPTRDEGMALITVVILGLIFSILGFTLFAMATFEFNQATYRDQSASAFWLAEAAIEHAKGEVFKHIKWEAGFDSVPRAEGWYNLAVSDTTYNGKDVTYWYAQGYVPRPGGGFVERDIEVFADLGPSGFEYALFSMHDIECTGNVLVCGLVHANEEIDAGGNCFDFGPQGAPDSCRGGVENISQEFEVLPPGMRTEPSFYPNTTYYYVVGDPNAGPGPGQARIVRALTPITPVWADSTQVGVTLVTIRTPSTADNDIRGIVRSTLDASDGVGVVYGGGTQISYNFPSTAAINTMFNWAAGKCTLDTRWNGTPDQNDYVIVNFGEYETEVSPSKAFRSNVDFHDSPSYAAPIQSSVFNTRYTTSDFSLEALTDSINWEGGNTKLSTVSFQPENGLALLIHAIDMSGPAQIEIGTPAKPAVFYITGSITGNFNANGNIYGTTIVLGRIDQLTGNVDFYYQSGYQTNLPPYLQPFWQNPSGHAEILVWREVPPKYRS